MVRGRAASGTIRVIKPTIVMRRLLADFAPTMLVISLTLGRRGRARRGVIGRAIATPIEGLTEFRRARQRGGDERGRRRRRTGRRSSGSRSAIDSMRRELEGRPFVETFAADLSHELKNPVAAIRASAEVLDEGALAEPEEARALRRRASARPPRASRRLLGEMLALARIEARGVDVVFEVDVGALARAASEAAKDRGAVVELTIDDGAIVRGQPNWLARAIDNLVDNAIVHGAAERRVAHRRCGARGDASPCAS